MSDDLPVAGQPHVLTYRVRINGVLTDLPTGGSVDELRMLQGLTVVLTVPGPATWVSTGTYEFPETVMPAAGDYTTEVDFRTSSGGPTKTDTNDVVRVYDFDGIVDDSPSDVSEVRLLIADLGTPPIFTDAQLEQFLTLDGLSVKLAAASALDVIASNEAMVSKRIRTLDLQTDGPAVAKALREHAALLREQHYLTLDSTDDLDFQTTTLLGTPAFPGWSSSPELTEG